MANLEIINQHNRDKNIKFYEEGHIYDVKGDKTYTSVTTFVHSFFLTLMKIKLLII